VSSPEQDGTSPNDNLSCASTGIGDHVICAGRSAQNQLAAPVFPSFVPQPTLAAPVRNVPITSTTNLYSEGPSAFAEMISGSPVTRIWSCAGEFYGDRPPPNNVGESVYYSQQVGTNVPYQAYSRKNKLYFVTRLKNMRLLCATSRMEESP